jgi:hypothetical protein
MANVRNVIVELIDYDGCYSNFNTMAVLSKFLYRYGEEILTLNEKRKRCLAGGQSTSEIEATVNEILATLPLYRDAADPRAEGGPLAAFTERAKRWAASGIVEHYSPMQLACLQVMKYVDAIYELDENIMLQIFLMTNPELIARLTSKAEPHQVRYIVPFTNRISEELNRAGRLQNPSGCHYRDCLLLVKHLKTKDFRIALLPITVTDIQARLDDGETFRRIYAEPEGDHAVAMCDMSKLTSVYAISHAVAERHPNAKVKMNAYDDHRRILKPLHTQFDRYPTLLRKGDELALHRYDGSFYPEDNYQVVVGSGEFDPRFRQNTCHLVAVAGCGSPRNMVLEVDVAKHVSITEFLAFRAVKAGEKAIAYLFDADGSLTNSARQILQLKIIIKFAEQLDGIQEIREAKQLRKNLYAQIKADIDSLDLDMTGDEYSEKLAYVEKNLKIVDKDLKEEVSKFRSMGDFITLRQYMRYLDNLSPKLMTRMLLRANREFFDNLVNRALTAGVNIGVVLSYSNRTSEQFDRANSRRGPTRSYFVDLHHLIPMLNEVYRGRFTFVLDRVLLADVYNNLQSGESFILSLIGSDQKPHSVFCEFKFNLTLFLTHYIRREYPVIQQAIAFDDRSDIFETLKRLLHDKQYLHLLPKGLSTDLCIYDGANANPAPCFTLSGVGELDIHIEHTLHVMATLAGVNLENLKFASLSHDFCARLNLEVFANRENKLPIVKPACQRGRTPSQVALQCHAVFVSLTALPEPLANVLENDSPGMLHRFFMLAASAESKVVGLRDSQVKKMH